MLDLGSGAGSAQRTQRACHHHHPHSTCQQLRPNERQSLVRDPQLAGGRAEADSQVWGVGSGGWSLPSSPTPPPHCLSPRTPFPTCSAPGNLQPLGSSASCLPGSLLLWALLPGGRTLRRAACSATFHPLHFVARAEIELDGAIRPAPCDNYERILFKNTPPFVQPVSNILLSPSRLVG